MDLSTIITLVIIFMVLIGLACFVVAKRKSQKPLLAALMGFIFSIIPVVGIIYLIVLLNKDDISA